MLLLNGRKMLNSKLSILTYAVSGIEGICRRYFPKTHFAIFFALFVISPPYLSVFLEVQQLFGQITLICFLSILCLIFLSVLFRALLLLTIENRTNMTFLISQWKRPFLFIFFFFFEKDLGGDQIR